MAIKNGKTLAASAGAVSLIGGMTFAIKKKEIMIPAFLGGWGLLSYGFMNGFKKVDPFTTAGIGGVVVGGMMARAKSDWGASEMVETVGKPLFMAGWASLAYGLSRQNRISPFATFAPSLAIVGGAMMMKKRAGGAWQDIPSFLPPILFAAGWVGLIYAISRRR